METTDIGDPGTSEPTPDPAPAPAAVGRARAAWRAARRRWYTRWPIDLFLAGVVFWAIGRYQSRNLLDDGLVAPAFTLTDLDGKTRSLADYRGKTVVVQFFAPWCAVCRFESDNWARIQSWRDDVQVLAVALSWEDRASVVDFIGGDQGAYPVLLGDDKVARDYKIESFPTHYIIGPTGHIVWQGSGYTPTVGLWWRLL